MSSEKRMGCGVSGCCAEGCRRDSLMRSEYRMWLTGFFLTASALLLLLPVSALAQPIVWYVNGISGNDSNNCQTAETACKTIGHAISRALFGDSIMVAAATYTENLAISFSLNVIGSGASTTIIDGGRASTVVTISTGSVVTLSGLTIRNGYASNGGGISNGGVLTISNSTLSGSFAQVSGGGILNKGILTINNSTLSGNLAFASIVLYSYGGGIENFGTVTINNSTLSGNTAGCGRMGCAGFGGGIYNGGELLINNSTLNGNVAYAHFAYSEGGGIVNNGGILTISNSTLSGNWAARGGGIFGGAVLQNSIVAYSPMGGDCNRTMSSKGYNLSSDNTCNFNGPGDLNNTDPKLGTLGYYGGPTQTIPLLSGSPAIDAGNPSGCTDEQGHVLKTDQRGQPRPDREDTGGCDMGAYESQSD
jgi:hypothetical protein